jgi:hypothetical protein
MFSKGDLHKKWIEVKEGLGVKVKGVCLMKMEGEDFQVLYNGV